MTKQELIELNDFCAEKVMGFESCIAPLQARGDTVPRYWRVLKGGYRRKVGWTPTTDPADAMLVLEKCAEKVGFRIAVQAVAEHWEVSRVCWENFTAHVTDIVEAETLPLAICLFSKALYESKNV